MKSNKSI
jgi:hypothetical protein